MIYLKLRQAGELVNHKRVERLRHMPSESNRRRKFRQGKETGILERGRAVTKAGEIGVVACEREKRGNAPLTDQHSHVPPLVFWADQERAAAPEKLDVTAALAKKGKRMLDVAVEGFCTTDASSRRQFGIGGIICYIAKAQQVQHYDGALDATLDKKSAGALRWGEIANGRGQRHVVSFRQLILGS